MGERFPFECVFCQLPGTPESVVRLAVLSNGAEVFAHSGCAIDHEVAEDEGRPDSEVLAENLPERWLRG